MEIELGPMCDKLAKQLHGALPVESLEVLDRQADAISLLYIRGILTEPEHRKACKRLLKVIHSKLNV